MSDKKSPQTWAGQYPVLHEDHVPELEAAAAVHEFSRGIPRADAEARAHGDYVQSKALDAAAHHLLGCRAAHGAGHDDAAMMHGQFYAGAMRAAGHDPFEAPPQEVLDRIKDAAPKIYNFKAHAADAMFSPETDVADGDDARIKAGMERLIALRDRAKASAAEGESDSPDRAEKPESQ